MRLRHLVCVLTFVAVPIVCVAHEGHDGHEHNEALEQVTAKLAATEELAKGVMLPAIEGPKPWSDAPVLNDDERFQIAIMTDRTGGHRPGIWMDGVRKVNMLRPEFVMSVGDLIEGYSDNRRQVENEWKEFLGFIDQMDMKFFFVAGNHDLTNPMMHKVWREHFGREWYSFDYKNVHFVCLNSEDPVDHIGEEQLDWLKSDMQQSVDARWTLVFIHKPLWTYAERSLASSATDNTNWKKVEALLAERKHTVFAGHIHHYVQYERNDSQYYALATTGGGSQLRGNDWGEFDHVTWLTMEKDGPHVVNIRLDGILPPDVVTEKSAERFRSFLTDVRLEVAPILIDRGSGFTEGEISIRLTNQFDTPVEATAELDGLPIRGLTVEPNTIKLTAAPSGTATQTVKIRFAEEIDFPSLSQTVLTAKVATTEGEKILRAERTVPVVIDAKFPIPTLAAMPDLDGMVDPQSTGVYGGNDFVTAGAVENYNGLGDLSYTLQTGTTGEMLYVAVRVTDDKVLDDKAGNGGDAVELLIDPRLPEQRRSEPALNWDGISVKAEAPGENGEVRLVAKRLRGGQPFEGVKAAGKRTESGYDIEFAIPTATFDNLQRGEWRSVQIGTVVTDVDEPNEKPVELWWRGAPGRRNTNTGHAYFARESDN